MTVSIIIPAYREYDSLQKNIPYLAARFPREDIHVIENGSKIAPDFSFLAVRTSTLNQKGLGIALRFGILTAYHKVVVFLPADLSFDLRFVRESEAIINAGWDLVIGSKMHYESKVQRPYDRRLISGLYNATWDLVYNLGVNDLTGVKAYNRESVKTLLGSNLGDGIRFEVNLIHEMRKRHMRILEIPVEVKDFGPSRYDSIRQISVR